MQKKPLPYPTQRYFFPALVYAYFASPLDALLSLCIPLDEAMRLVLASWQYDTEDSILAEQNGGRCVAIIPLAGRRWAACLAFKNKASIHLADAERACLSLHKRGKTSLIGVYSCHDLA